jgi:diaminohydroxyphosphoribosylaminopyrimidine deaminase/5-amino-6-(5-phosphoribosylamino)uracil reductase
MSAALRLAARGLGRTSPNPMVGALLVRRNDVIGRGFHRGAGLPHAEIEALHDAARRGKPVHGATLYVTLEPCCTHGRTPPCTDAIVAAGIKRVVVAATDPNPQHAGRGFKLLRKAGIEVVAGVLDEPATELNAAFNHWIVQRTPFVTVKAAMTLDGRIATRTGESKWITGERARAYGMNLRAASDAILVGINTVLADDPALTLRPVPGLKLNLAGIRQPRRIVLDSQARTPIQSRLVADDFAALTTVVVSHTAPPRRIAALQKRVEVRVAPSRRGALDIRWLLKELGRENVTSLLVEGGGEANAAFLLGGLAQRIAFFYAPLIVGGRSAPKGVGGEGVSHLADALRLDNVEYQWLGPDLLLTASVEGRRVES